MDEACIHYTKMPVPKDQPPCDSTKMDSSVSSLDAESTVTAARSQGSEK